MCAVALGGVHHLGAALRGEELVLVGDVDHQRLRHLAELVEQVVEADAVIGDVDVGVGLLGHHEGEPSAEAVAHRADAAVAARQLARGGDGRLEVVDALRLVEAVHQRKARFHSASDLSVISTPRSCRQNRSGQRARKPRSATRAAVSRMASLTPKSPGSPPRRRPASASARPAGIEAAGAVARRDLDGRHGRPRRFAWPCRGHAAAGAIPQGPTWPGDDFRRRSRSWPGPNTRSTRTSPAVSLRPVSGRTS